MPELETEHVVDSMRIFNGGRRPRLRRIRPHRMYNWGQAHMLRSTKLLEPSTGRFVITTAGLISNSGPPGVVGIARARNRNVCAFQFLPQSLNFTF